MTQPDELPEPVTLRLVEAFHERAGTQVDGLLTQIVTALQAGDDARDMPRRVDATIGDTGMDYYAVMAIAAVAVARLAGMHHAVEQLADKWHEQAMGLGRLATELGEPDGCGEAGQASSFTQAATELRKLVDDHG